MTANNGTQSQLDLLRQLSNIDKEKSLSNGTSKHIDVNEYSLKSILDNNQNVEPLKKLFGNFILQNEITFLGANTGIGKSLLSYQICDGLSKGAKILNLLNETEPLKCLYLDFELSPRNLISRYKENNFNQNFYVKFASDIYQETENIDYDYLKQQYLLFKYNFLVIDNVLAMLKPSQELQSQSNSIELSKTLLRLKNDLNVNILLISHITKTNEVELNINSIQGAKVLTNLSDSVLMLGYGRQNERYIKHVKSRNSQMYSDCLLMNLPSDEPNLFFEFISWQTEKSIISNDVTIINDDNKDLALQLFKTQSQQTYSDLKRTLINDFKKTEWKAKNIIANLINNNILIKDNFVYMINQNEVKTDYNDNNSEITENIEQTW